MNDYSISSISPLDGRYISETKVLSGFFSEMAFIKYRVRVEIFWLIELLRTNMFKMRNLPNNYELYLLKIIYNFNIKDVIRIKNIEKITNHDVKAIEYWIKEYLSVFGFECVCELVHFACTSEDINNIAYALMIKDATYRSIIPILKKIYYELINTSYTYSNNSMLSRTHGQIASSTTLGKEIANTTKRLFRSLNNISDIKFYGKMNGAVGNFNAHVLAFPNFNWELLSRFIIEKRFNLKFNSYTTQIEPHDYMAELFDSISRTNTILLDFSRNIWSYISLGYLRQKIVKNEIGSSTMPHKINPINFENAEGNLGISNAILKHFSEKLPISRLQRDLSDSTVLRNIGVAFGYSLVAYRNIRRGVYGININNLQILNDSKKSWVVLSEPIQVIMRFYNIRNAYEQLKCITRGKKITKDILHKFIKNLNIPINIQFRLLNITPIKYIGISYYLAKNIK